MSTLTRFLLSTDHSTITNPSDTHLSRSVQVDLSEKTDTNRRLELIQESSVPTTTDSIAN